MHRQAFIFSDAAGYPRRAARLRGICEDAGVPFVHLCPTDKPVLGAIPVQLPEAWLGTPQPCEPPPPPGHREWARCHLYAVLGARLLPPADHYWLVEADVTGPSATWARLLSQTADLPEDGLWSRIFENETHPNHPAFAISPRWCDTYALGCLLRISAAGLAVWEETAIETREVFTELAAPSTLKRAGLTIGKINRPGQPGFYHTGTLRFNPGRSAVEPDISSTLLRHPEKRDDP